MTITWTLSADVNMLAGQPVTGYARIEAVGAGAGPLPVVIPAIRDTESNFIFSGPQRIRLIDGKLLTTLEDPVRLPDSTGQSGFSPLAWSYRVTLLLDHLSPSQYPVYVFQLGSDLDLADVVSAPPITDPLDNPWVESAAEAEAARDAALAIRDELVAMLDEIPHRREANRMDVTSSDFHPATRPRDQRFDGTSHPLSDYFATLADAQTLYPFATTLTDETDWAALQLALNSVIAYPKGWGTEPNDWRQYGTAALVGPTGGLAMINRPIIKAANTNENVRISSPAPWGFRLKYTGVDGGRLFEFERDSIGSVLVLENLVLEGGGVRVRAPYRGYLLFTGCHAVDTPHAALTFEDTPTGVGGTGVGQPAGVGVVGPIVEKFYTSGCAGSVWQLSSTATITVLRDVRFLSNRDEVVKVTGTTDVLIDGIDVTGMEAVAAAAGKPYFRFSAETAATNNVELRNARMGPEDYTMGGYTYGSPREPVIIGGDTLPSPALAVVRFRKVAFRTPPVVSALICRAAVRLNAKCVLDVDDCDFGEHYECLIDEAPYLAAETLWTAATTFQSRWGDNQVDAGHKAALFSNGGVNFTTPSRLPTTIDRRAGADVGDSANLVSTDLGTWTATSCTVGAAVTGGPDGVFYFPVTKTGAGMLLSTSVTMTAGRRYVFGFRVRREAGSAIRTARLRVNRGATIMHDQQRIRLDGEWVTYWWRIPYVPTTGAATVAIWLDNAEEAANGAVVGVCLPFVNDGVTPKSPRTTLRLTGRRNGPSSPTAGAMYGADGITWDPLSRGAGLPYVVLWNGSSWQAVSNVDPTGSGLYVSELAATATVANTLAGTLWTAANLPAAQLAAGATVLRFRISGTFDNPATSGVFNARVRVNGTLIATVSIAPTQTNASTGLPWQIDADLFVDATGAGGAVTLLGSAWRVSTATGTGAAANVQAVGVAVDLSGGLQLSVEGAMGTASVDRIIRAFRGIVQQVK